MEKEFVPHTESLALKELGFDEPCLAIYNRDGEFSTVGDVRCPYTYLNNTHPIHREGNGVVCIPTYSQAFRFFREKYDLSGFVLPFGEGLFDYRIYSAKKGEHLWSSIEYKTHEDAELACLRKLIEVCQKK